MSERKGGGVRRFLNWIVLLAAAALIAGLILGWKYCGRGGGGKGVGGGGGIGTGGGTATGVGPGDKTGTGSKAGDATGSSSGRLGRCQLRIDETGLSRDGKPITREKAVEVCTPLGDAEIQVIGTTRYGDFEELKKALEAKGVRVFVVD